MDVVKIDQIRFSRGDTARRQSRTGYQGDMYKNFTGNVWSTAARTLLEIGYDVCVFNSCSGGLTTDPEPSNRTKIGQVPADRREAPSARYCRASQSVSNGPGTTLILVVRHQVYCQMIHLSGLNHPAIPVICPKIGRLTTYHTDPGIRVMSSTSDSWN